MQFFNDCQNVEQCRSKFRILSKQLHPDLGGNAELFKVMLNEYQAWNQFNDEIVNSWEHRPATGLHDGAVECIRVATGLDGVIVDVVGAFVWCRGDTRQHKTILKGLGMFWAPKSQAWMLKTPGWKRRAKKPWGYNKARSVYGSAIQPERDGETRIP